MEIIYTIKAKKDIKEILNYIKKNFSQKEANVFLDEVEKTVTNIVNNNNIGKVYENSIYKQILVSKQAYLFYIIENNKLILITFFNNVQNVDLLNRILFS